MGSSSPALSNMQFLVLLSAFALAFAYVHDATGDVAVDDSPAALPYVHDATGDVADASSPEAEAYVHDVTGDTAVPYVHEEPVVAPVVAATYAAYPYTYGAYPYLHAGAHVVAPVAPKVEVKAAAPAAVAPVTYAAYPHYGYAGYPYAVAAYHTGCVNNVGSVVPCA